MNKQTTRLLKRKVIPAQQTAKPRVVQEWGGSRYISLPVGLCDRLNITKGDVVMVHSWGEAAIIIRPLIKAKI